MDLIIVKLTCSCCPIALPERLIINAHHDHPIHGGGGSACGVVSYYIPRSNPDGVAVTVHCLDPATIKSVTTKHFDGQNWEQFYANSDIKQCSKD